MNYVVKIAKKLLLSVENYVDIFITVPFSGFFLVSIGLLSLGLLGVVVLHSNVIAILLSLEIALLGTFNTFLYGAFYVVQPVGGVYAVLLLSLAGAESAIGLSLLVTYYNEAASIDVTRLSVLRG